MPSTTRIAILGLNFPPEPTGISPYTGSLAHGLVERGMILRVLTTHPHYPEWAFRKGYGQWSRREDIDGVRVSRLRHYLPTRPEGVRRLISELSFGARLLFARWGRPNIVVMVSPALFSTAVAVLRARFSPAKPAVVVWVQDLYSLGITETGAGGGLVARLMTWVESKTLKAATRVVVIHERFAAYVSNSLGVDPSKIEVVRNWTHLQPTVYVDREAVRCRHGWRDEETVVLHAGNMGAKQGLENVIDAARLSDVQGAPVRFVLLGNGSQRDRLHELAYGIARLQFIDSLDDDAFQSILAAADVLLVNEKPGVSEMAVPSKLTSYFNAGRPVLAATDMCGVTAGEIDAAGAGTVVEAGDPQALLDAAVALGQDSERAQILGASGLRYREEVLGEEAALNRYAGILTSLAAERGR
ncbi:glycosyltransferase [Glaciibacter sp. 2TAF33]|uniref:glycosyltransferase n=1 Tax=Glaciibacter sp. 2TAF33 TaxID=3233015 RepID=UPI003F92CF9A